LAVVLIFKDWNARHHSRERADFSLPYGLTDFIDKFAGGERAGGFAALPLHACYGEGRAVRGGRRVLGDMAALLSERPIQSNRAGIKPEMVADKLRACNFGPFPLNSRKTII
jgi:hypothetical protein